MLPPRETMRVRFTTQMLNSIAVREGEEITNKGQMDGVGWPLYFHLGATVCALINYIFFARLTIALNGVVHLKLI